MKYNLREDNEYFLRVFQYLHSIFLGNFCADISQGCRICCANIRQTNKSGENSAVKSDDHQEGSNKTSQWNNSQRPNCHKTDNNMWLAKITKSPSGSRYNCHQ